MHICSLLDSSPTSILSFPPSDNATAMSFHQDTDFTPTLRPILHPTYIATTCSPCCTSHHSPALHLPLPSTIAGSLLSLHPFHPTSPLTQLQVLSLHTFTHSLFLLLCLLPVITLSLPTVLKTTLPPPPIDSCLPSILVST